MGHIYEGTQSPAVIGINHAIIVVTILAEIQTFITPFHPPIIKFYLMLDTQFETSLITDTSELDVASGILVFIQYLSRYFTAYYLLLKV